MSKSQRTKGAAGEREVCDLILRDLGIEVHRNLQQTRDGGADIKLKPFSIEPKSNRRRSLNYHGSVSNFVSALNS